MNWCSLILEKQTVRELESAHGPIRLLSLNYLTLGTHSTYQGVTLDLGGHQVVEDLGQLGQVDMDQLSLEVQTEQRKEVPFLNL